uniref:Galectin n=1 Tax=Oreochromis niloticus TaxID=8128 RepID=A0A669CCT3_ORENI
FPLQKIQDMSIKQGLELKVRVKPGETGDSFAINIGHDSENIAMHLNPRLDSNTIVFNSLSGGTWGDEIQESNFPFRRGEECKINVIHLPFSPSCFFLLLHMINFPNRLGDVKYKYFDVSGDARIIGIKLK